MPRTHPAPPTSPATSRPALAPELAARVRRSAENRPGIYRFVGPRGELLYIGKSVRLRTRLLSYFRVRDGKPRELLRVARGIEWEYAPNEFEALLREFRQIRAFRPRFNVHHRRERRFAWVKLTREDAPRLLATRRPIADGAEYFGPFPATRSLPETVRDLAHALGIRDCPARTPMHFSDQLDLLAPARTPRCARAELGSCPAPCAALVSREAYHARVSEASSFLRGASDEPLARIRTRMESAARGRAFELAARWRDRAERIERMRTSIGEYRDYMESLRFVYRVPGTEHGGDRAFLVVDGRVRMTFDDPPPASVRTAFRSALDAGSGGSPPLNAEAREELFLVARWFRDRPDELDRTMDPLDYLRGLDP